VFCSTACTTNGSSYISLVNSNVGYDPPTSNVKWALIAQAGATGATGATGPAGPTGPTGATGATGPSGSGSHIFMADVVLGYENSTTYFFAPNQSGDPAFYGATWYDYNNFATFMPVACTFDSLYLAASQIGNYNGSSGSFTSPIIITLFRNGSATALTQSITPPSGTNLVTASITGQSVAVSAGDTIAFQATSTSFSTNSTYIPFAQVQVTSHCQ
jgi:hypothetical protein